MLYLRIWASTTSGAIVDGLTRKTKIDRIIVRTGYMVRHKVARLLRIGGDNSRILLMIAECKRTNRSGELPVFTILSS